MNLISCNNCAVVLDKDNLSYPVEIWNDETDSYDETKSVYSRSKGRYVAKVQCPVCGEDILDD